MEENIHNTGNLLLTEDINIKINIENDPGTMIFNNLVLFEASTSNKMNKFMTISIRKL